jgi:hypothetical protein
MEPTIAPAPGRNNAKDRTVALATGYRSTRTSRSVRLTPLGERLRDRLHTGYSEIMAGLERPSSPLAGRSAP